MVIRALKLEDGQNSNEGTSHKPVWQWERGCVTVGRGQMVKKVVPFQWAFHTPWRRAQSCLHFWAILGRHTPSLKFWPSVLVSSAVEFVLVSAAVPYAELLGSNAKFERQLEVQRRSPSPCLPGRVTFSYWQGPDLVPLLSFMSLAARSPPFWHLLFDCSVWNSCLALGKILNVFWKQTKKHGVTW